MICTFALDYVIEAVFVCYLTLSECKYQFLVVLRKNKAFESPVVPLDFLDIVNGECYCIPSLSFKILKGIGQRTPLFVLQRVSF